MQQMDLIGSRLAVLSKKTGHTQEEIAQKLQISRITINRFFKGRTEIRSGDLVQLLNLFGIDIGKLLDERVERLMNGRILNPSNDHMQVTQALEDLDPDVSQTILDQVSWWKNAAGSTITKL